MESDRESYLAICQTCSKSKFDRKKGLVCSLTNAHANFDLNSICPSYENDEKFTRIQAAAKKRVTVAMEDDSTASFWRPFSIIFISAGALMCILGTFNFLWHIKFAFAPVGLFFSITGLLIFSKGYIEFNKLKPKKKKPKQFQDFDDHLDEII
jgi:hypothetical protein